MTPAIPARHAVILACEAPGMHILEECGGFFREFRRQFRTTGAILPSSPFLAAALSTRLRSVRPPSRILEVGPGTGAVTRAIARHMLPDDQLDAVEINGQFVSLLERRLLEDGAFAHCCDRIEVIHAALEDLPGEGVYDYIVSGLPLNNFRVDQVREIFAAFQRLLKPGGTLSFFEYVFVRQLKSPFVDQSERRRLFRVGRVVSRYIRAYQVGRQRVFMNVPPAIVRHLRLASARIEVARR